MTADDIERGMARRLAKDARLSEKVNVPLFERTLHDMGVGVLIEVVEEHQRQCGNDRKVQRALIKFLAVIGKEG